MAKEIKVTQFFEQHSPQIESLSPFIEKTSFHADEGTGALYVAKLYPGVLAEVIDFDINGMEVPAIEADGFLTLNYCFSGQYEMRTPNDRYFYVKAGLLNVDMTPPAGRTIYTVGKYAGLEITINYTELQQNPPASWKEFGIDFSELMTLLATSNGSYLAQSTPEWNRMASELAGHITHGNLPIEDYRFQLLQLLWAIKTEKKLSTIFRPTFLTAGQRAVVLRTEALMTKDLRKRYVITDLATDEGVSAATLKSHFALVFGKPISSYLKERRIEKAKELLITGKMSIEEISNTVGYENQAKFAAMFREETGVSPTEYRRLNRI